MDGSPDEARARAETKFQKQQQAEQQASEAKVERETQVRAVEANTARLKSLRLAKEAADKEAPPKQPETSSKAKPASTKKKPSP